MLSDTVLGKKKKCTTRQRQIRIVNSNEIICIQTIKPNRYVNSYGLWLLFERFRKKIEFVVFTLTHIEPVSKFKNKHLMSTTSSHFVQTTFFVKTPTEYNMNNN